MNNIVTYITGLTDIVLRFIACDCYLYKKENINTKKQIIVIGILSVINYIVKDTFKTSVANLSDTICITVFMSIIFYKDKLSIKLLISIIVILISIIIDIAVSLSAYNILKLEINSRLITLIYLFLEFIVIQFIRRRKLKTIHAGDSISYLRLLILPFVSLLFIVIFYYSEINTNEFDFVQFYVTITFLIIINAMHYIIYENEEKLYQENYENLILNQKYQFRDEYYKKLESHQEEIRTLKHDLKNQLIRISAYDKEQLNKEITSMIDSLDKKDIFFTKNIGIDLLLYVKYKEAIEKEIDCNFNIKIPEYININERDITVILGNVIDNAIEACEKCVDQKFINLTILLYNNMLAIQILNSTDGLVKNIKTRKRNQIEHGLGIKSVQRIVNKYNGECNYTIENKVFKFTINIWTSSS